MRQCRSETIVRSNTNRVFRKVAEHKFVFDRENITNLHDIAQCAALSFHKAIMGIAELYILEQGGHTYRFAKAVQTYYAVYHLLACNMLLAKDFIIELRDPMKYEVDQNMLNSELETSTQWHDSKELEQDLASRITHSQIHSYCESLRNNTFRDKHTEVIYKAFAEDTGDLTCIPGLYEKLCYIRDRAVYRPTYVIYSDGSGEAQTSLYIRQEIESLPSSKVLYDILIKYYQALIENDAPLFKLFKAKLRYSKVDCKQEYMESLGYTWEKLERMGGCKDESAVPSYLCQLMELFDPDDTECLYEKFWKPIIEL